MLTPQQNEVLGVQVATFARKEPLRSASGSACDPSPARPPAPPRELGRGVTSGVAARQDLRDWGSLYFAPNASESLFHDPRHFSRRRWIALIGVQPSVIRMQVPVRRQGGAQ
jgi:hypothetical protein